MLYASLLKVDKAVIAKGKDKDMVWELAMFTSKGIHTIPAWNDFSAMTSDKTVPVATIRNLPFIYAPSKDLSSIYTTLLRLMAIAEKLGQPHILVTGDLTIYLKAQQILWIKPESLEGKVTMPHGGMHLLVAFVASIGPLVGETTPSHQITGLCAQLLFLKGSADKAALSAFVCESIAASATP